MKLYCTLIGKLFFSQFWRCSTDAFETVDAQRSNRCEFTFLLHCLVSSRELFSPAQKYQLLVYHADAIFHDKEYRNAACKYSMALQQKKVLSKTSKVRTSTSGAAANIQAQVWGAGARRARVEGQLYTVAFWLWMWGNQIWVTVFQSLPSEIEVKYKIAECYTILKLDKDAIAVLEGIPSRQRTPKVRKRLLLECQSFSFF